MAICEQTEVCFGIYLNLQTPSEAKSRGKRKSPVLERSVVRLISAGTLVEDAFLSPRQSNFLCALSSTRDNSHFGFSVIDISTGEYAVHNVDSSQLASLFARYDPREILLSHALQSNPPSALASFLASDSVNETRCMVTVLDDTAWESGELQTLIDTHSELAALSQPFREHLFSEMELDALHALLQYINTTQMGAFPRLFCLEGEEEEDQRSLELDRSTRDSLNLTRGSRDTLTGSVLNVWQRGNAKRQTIDRTVTVMGSRLLSNRLSSPLTQPKEINHRLDVATAFRIES